MTIRSSQEPIQNKTDVSASALKLLQFEAAIRQCSSKEALIFHIVNQLNRLISYEQAFVLSSKSARHFQVVASSDVSQIESSSPVIRALKKWASSLEDKNTAGSYELNDIMESSEGFPYTQAYWLPLKYDNQLPQQFLLLFANDAFSEQQQALLNRLSQTYGHAFLALSAKRAPKKAHTPFKVAVKLCALALLLFVCIYPMQISVMAPVEVVAKAPFIVTAPFNGVIKTVDVPPNTQVTKDQLLIKFEDIQLRNEYLVEQQRLSVAKANFDKIQGAAFTSNESAYEINIARAELSLALVKVGYTREQLGRTQIRSPLSGLVIYSDKESLEGRAVQVGERILQVAQTDQINYRIELPVGQAIAFEEQAKVTIYLDSAPLGGHQASLDSASYLPHVTPEGVASYTLLAKPLEGETPKIGARGTARIYGDKAPLIWHVLRRPVNTVRQWLGV